MEPSKTLSSSATLPLNQGGLKIPVYGLGVWDSATNVCKETCIAALRNGYQQIDTAQMYGNEKEVGEGVAASGVPRGEIFITTKIFEPAGSAAATYAQCERSAELLGGYADLFLIHAPLSGFERTKEMWQALEKLHKAGKARTIGVSNFNQRHIEEMKQYATVWPPAVNQLELHPWHQQREAAAYCRSQHIVLQQYCPIVRMQKAEEPHLVRIAKAAGKSTTQVLIRYGLQKGWVPLPKSDKEQRIRDNADVFDFELSAEDMQALDQRETEDGKLALCHDVSRL